MSLCPELSIHDTKLNIFSLQTISPIVFIYPEVQTRNLGTISKSFLSSIPLIHFYLLNITLPILHHSYNYS